MEVFDVKVAFPNANPGMTMYIKVPEVMILWGMMSRMEANNTAYLLDKPMYGNVDVTL